MEHHGHQHHQHQRQQHNFVQRNQRDALKENLKNGFTKVKQFFKKPKVQTVSKVVGVVTAVVLVGCAVAAGVIYLSGEDLGLQEYINNIFGGH